MSIKEKLTAAIALKDNDVKTFVWKGRKHVSKDGITQNEIKLIDCSENELRGFYNHCDMMLYNTDKDNPGRYILLDIIKDQRTRCNVELFIRYLEAEEATHRLVLKTSIQEFLDNNPQVDAKTYKISNIASCCPSEFANLTLDLILDGCTDRLGKFSKKHITRTFILKQGLWFTSEESKMLIEKNEDGTVKDKWEVAAKKLGLDPSNKVYITSKGLSLSQMKAMLNLKSCKYSEMSNEQLLTLRNKILFYLEDDVKFHIKQWETRQRQIKLVCEHKKYNL